MEIKKGKVNNVLMDVISPEEYYKHPNLYNNSTTTAIQTQDNVLLPLRDSNTMDRPGYYPMSNGICANVVMPNKSEIDNYRATKESLIDFSNPKDFAEIIQSTTNLKELERQILTTPDNIFVPNISEKDTVEMKGFKEATIAKHIDIDKYADRIDNFPNNKRIFNDTSITLLKLKQLGKALDMSISLTFKDREPDVPNPIGKEITVDITSGGKE